MARLPRLAIAGEVHLVLHVGHNRQVIFGDDEDRRRLLAVLREVRLREQVAIHGYALLPHCLWLLATPAVATALGRLMQAAGRRYTVDFNRRTGRSGTLWEGRFRSTVVAPGQPALEALVFVDQAAVREMFALRASDYPWSSAKHYAGEASDPLVSDLPGYWLLGNTPFERAARYSKLLEEPLAQARAAQVLSSVQGGWALASEDELARLQQRTRRRLRARPRGRPGSEGHRPLVS
jgi:putative transposase